VCRLAGDYLIPASCFRPSTQQTFEGSLKG
jgi:hypothetical protein